VAVRTIQHNSVARGCAVRCQSSIPVGRKVHEWVVQQLACDIARDN
jgi:hypothetical protein